MPKFEVSINEKLYYLSEVIEADTADDALEKYMEKIRAYYNRQYINSKYGDKLYLDEDETYIKLAILKGEIPKTEEVLIYEALGSNKQEAENNLNFYLNENFKNKQIEKQKQQNSFDPQDILSQKVVDSVFDPQLVKNYETIDVIDFKNVFANLMNILTGAISIKKDDGSENLKILNTMFLLYQRVFGMCFDPNKEIDVSGSAKLSELDLLEIYKKRWIYSIQLYKILGGN